jgi:hypothetical protein
MTLGGGLPLQALEHAFLLKCVGKAGGSRGSSSPAGGGAAAPAASRL